jgi:uncharacterized protein YycO
MRVEINSKLQLATAGMNTTQSIKAAKHLVSIVIVGLLFLFTLECAFAQTRSIDSWLDYKFDSTAPVGDAKNPAVILPSTIAELLGDVPGLKRNGDAVIVPAAQFQQIAKQPLAAIALGPTLNQLSNVKSFDGFNAVDLTGLIRNLPSEILEIPDRAARRANGQNLDEIRKLLRDGDILLGSHVVNYMTWGRFNHVAMVFDAERGGIVEARVAGLSTDRPGVAIGNWQHWAEGYSRIGVVRVKGMTREQFEPIKQWLARRNGRPYRWPIMQGLDKTDQSRFYCSQLVWLAFREGLDIDLDVDKGMLVFPDDIYNSKDYVEVIVP